MTQSRSADRRLQSSELEAFVARALTAVGLPAPDAEQVARLMILADLRGADGHGIFRLPQYVRRIRAGGMNVRPNIRVARFSPVETFKRNVDQVIREMRNSRKMPGVDQIRLPGEQSHATWLERSALGIPLNDALFKDLQRLASDLGIEGLPASD